MSVKRSSSSVWRHVFFECHYRGIRLDGEEFQSSYLLGQPATFPIAPAISGWQEALKLKPVGSKWKFVRAVAIRLRRAGIARQERSRSSVASATARWATRSWTSSRCSCSMSRRTTAGWRYSTSLPIEWLGERGAGGMRSGNATGPGHFGSGRPRSKPHAIRHLSRSCDGRIPGPAMIDAGGDRARGGA